MAQQESYIDRTFGLTGKRVIVTGASSGLGEVFARSIAQAGAVVALVARRADRLESLASEIRANGGEAHAIVADLEQREDCLRMMEQASAALGGLDVLINNAGVADLARPEKLSAEEWRRVLAIDLDAVFHTAQAAGRILIAQGNGGRIINISSVVGSFGNSVFPTTAYAAAKAGVEGLTRQLACEWGPHGITVNAVAPGWFPTEMNVDPRHGDVHPKYKEMMIERIPLKRLGNPEELAGAVIFLASAAGEYVTGSVLRVDGGWTTW